MHVGRVVKYKVNVKSVERLINRAHATISVEVSDYLCNSTLSDMPYVEYIDIFQRVWYQKTKSFFDSKLPNKKWLVFDTEEDYIRFLIQWSD